MDIKHSYRVVDQPWTVRDIYPLQTNHNRDNCHYFRGYRNITVNTVINKYELQTNLGMPLPIGRNSASLQAPRLTHI